MKTFYKKIEKYLPLIKIAITTVLLLLGLFLPVGEYWKLGLYIAALVIIGVEPLIESFNMFRTHTLDENFLMVIASVGAFVLGEYAEGIAVLLLYAIGEYFEHYAVNKSRTFISQLVNMRTPYAYVLRDGEFQKVAPEEVETGEITLIKPGEKVPLDGVIIEGTSLFDASALTGESLPREVSTGDVAVSGCINLTSAIKVRTEKKYEDSTVAKILDMVENSALKKAKAENFITKFAKFYTPIVVGLAVLIAIIPPLIDDMQWEKWIYKALSFLVISCPCALVISVPLSFFRGIGLASKRGILVKGSHYMELLAKLKAVACDKTGTLTKGKFYPSDVKPFGVSEEELLTAAKISEGDSNHPIAKAIVEKYGAIHAEKYEEIPGRGAKAEYCGKVYYAGNSLFMDEIGVKIEEYDGAGSVVYFAEGDRYLGYIAVKDEIKESSYGLKTDLSKVGVEKLVLLSGDGEAVCREVSEKLGIDEYYGELLPQDKVEKLREVRAKANPIAFIGDGINDAPCLAEADVGIAMGGMGSDLAIETADLVIMKDDPVKVAEAVKISKRTVKISVENIVFALGVKLAVMILTIVGFSNILLAIFADVGVSILAILNAIRPMSRKK